MPPASKKHCSVILFDLAAEPIAKQCLIKICCNNFFSRSKDLTKLILFNSSVTENRLNARHGKGYNNIYEVSEEITAYNPESMLEMIEGNSETTEANWLEGLAVALKNLKDVFEDIGGIITFQVLFITDLKTSLANYDEDLVGKIVQTIQNLDAFLYVVGPNIEVPFIIKSDNDVRSWMKDLKVDSENQNLTVLKKIISETKNSVVCDYKIGVHLFFSFRNWGGTQPWQVPLAVGSKIKIPAQTMKILDRNPKCRLKKTTKGRLPVKWVKAGEEGEEVDETDAIGGIMRHGKFVQMPSSKMFQVENPRGFNVLCFTDSKNVPEYLMRGEGCYCVLPKGSPEEKEALNILIDCLAEQKKYVIARRIYNNNFAPKIVVLVPKPDFNPKCFLLTSLPFNDNMQSNYKEKDPESVPEDEDGGEEEVNDVINQFLDSINIHKEKSVKKINLGINMMESANTMKIINMCADKMLNKEMKLKELDINLLEPEVNILSEDLREMWPERVPKSEFKKKKSGDESSDEDFDW